MAGEAANEDQSPAPTPGRHIALVTDDSKDNKIGENGSEPSPVLTNGKGWDGKLRIPGRVSLANPEALSDPEYSDDENVVPGDEIQPDEGKRKGPQKPKASSKLPILCLVRCLNADHSTFQTSSTTKIPTQTSLSP